LGELTAEVGACYDARNSAGASLDAHSHGPQSTWETGENVQAVESGWSSLMPYLFVGEVCQLKESMAEFEQDKIRSEPPNIGVVRSWHNGLASQ
jgi:hypothetical protein